MDDIDKINALLKEHGAVLERTKKHKIWRFPGGRIWVVPSTPSCSHAYRNNYHELLDFLGVKTVRRKNPDRKEKRGVAGKAAAIASGVKLRDPREALAAIRKYCRPMPCDSAMWLERVRVTPLMAILRRLFRRSAA